MPSVGDAQLAVHAASSLPAWLWTLDGTRVLWANPVGAQLFGARNATFLAEKTFGPADPHRRQIAQLSTRLRPDVAPRLERLRGFGAPLGRLVTCACSHLLLADGRPAILIAAAENIGRPMPLTERLQRLVQDADVPMAAFGRDGVFVGASDAARALAGFRSLSDAGLDATREQALRNGRAETPVGFGHLVLQRVGSGMDIGLIAMLEPAVLAALRPALPKPESRPDDAPPAESSDSATVTDMPDEESEPHDEISPRTQPLRFVWETNSSGHLTIRTEELLHLIGPQSAASFDGGTSLADADRDGRLAAALATHAVWSGVNVRLPADGLSDGLPAELTGLPLFDANGFAGYRGFGMCHDLAALTHLQTLRHRESHTGHAPRSLSAHSPIAEPTFEMPDSNEPPDSWQEGAADHPSEEAALNVVPFRPSNEAASPALTAGESSAFDELARELTTRLASDVPASAVDEAAMALRTETPPASTDAPVSSAAPDFTPLLDAVGDALMFVNESGSIEFANRAAGELFANDAEALKQVALADLFAPESAERIASWLRSPDAPPQDTHELQLRNGDPLSATLVRAPGSLPCLVLRSLALHRQHETEIATARRETALAVAEKSEILNRISEELRTPLTAIIGFAEVMISQRFGPLGNDRYVEYLKDIRGSGERVVAIVDDLLDLASIESGHRDLDFANQDLNDLVEQTVAAMQPQANRERIIIRSSLSHVLPPVVADGRTLRQILVNLIGNSIQLANPGGQVIVSTTAQNGEVMLRLRDSGHGLNDNEVESALAPFRSAEDNSEPAAIRLSLTRALIQANRARFQMRAAPYAGTLIEVAFPAS